ncbi:MFS transporter [Amycolatopsis echigonensis]|uniref:MFS family arabinose efflux permease n=1 Tax=Amycolatopsis echigonensis TaxID=2576905 RepID=A0A2N3WQ46_9PSEU|nr:MULTISPECIES: MFS transporter [Amycolatopsis]MBB2505355.1 MFS transporter [Amycolatopsis echigonensis]PKV95989.1 putative MFS family arabinose efflux permease [Amycolatopsis niigatensis]
MKVATITAERTPVRGLPSLAWALGACHLVARGGSFVQPMLVLYLTQEQRMTPTAAGAVVAAVGIGDFASQLLGGWLGDRIGRRRTMLLGFLGTAIALAALGSAETIAGIWVTAVGYGLAAGLFRPAGSAAVADLPPDQRVRAYSLLYWAANLGYAVAATVAGVLASRGYGLLFWLNAVAMLAAALIVVAAVPETRSAANHDRRALLPVLRTDRLMITMTLIHVGCFTVLMLAFATLPLLMTAQQFSSAAYGSVLALNGFAIVVLQPLAVAVLANRDRGTVLAASMLLVGLGGGLAAVTSSIAGYAVAVLVISLGQIGFAVQFGATFAALAPPDLRSGYLGVASSAWSLGAVLGPVAGTALLQQAGRTWLGIAAFAAGILLFLAQKAVAGRLRERQAGQLTEKGTHR